MSYSEAIRELEALAAEVEGAAHLQLHTRARDPGVTIIPRYQKMMADALRRWASELRTQSIP